MKNLAKAAGAEHDFYDFSTYNGKGITSYYEDEQGNTRYIVDDSDDSGKELDLSEAALYKRLDEQRKELAKYLLIIDGKGKNPFSKDLGKDLGFVLDSGVNIGSSKLAKPIVTRPNTSHGYDSSMTNMDIMLDLESQRKKAIKMPLLGETEKNQTGANNSKTQEVEVIDDLAPFTTEEDDVNIVDLNALIAHRAKERAQEEMAKSAIQPIGDIDDETIDNYVNYYSQENVTVVDDLVYQSDNSKSDTEEQMDVMDGINDDNFSTGNIDRETIDFDGILKKLTLPSDNYREIKATNNTKARVMKIGGNIFEKAKKNINRLKEGISNIFNSKIKSKRKDKVTSSSESKLNKFSTKNNKARIMNMGEKLVDGVKKNINRLKEGISNIFNSKIKSKRKDKVTSSGESKLNKSSTKNNFDNNFSTGSIDRETIDFDGILENLKNLPEDKDDKTRVKNNTKSRIHERINSRNDSTKFSLKRGLVTAGITLVIGATSFSALKNVPKFCQSQDNKITMESNDEALSGLTSFILANTLHSTLKVVNEQQSVVKNQMPSIEAIDAKEGTIKFGANIKLNNGVRLGYTSMGDGPSIKVGKLKCVNYNINRIAVLSKDGKKVIYNKEITKRDKSMDVGKFTEEWKSKHGNDVKFAINVDGVTKDGEVYEEAGWTSLDNMSMSTGKVNIKTFGGKKL